MRWNVVDGLTKRFYYARGSQVSRVQCADQMGKLCQSDG